MINKINKGKNRFIAALMCLVMIITMLPLTLLPAYASSEPKVYVVHNKEVINELLVSQNTKETVSASCNFDAEKYQWQILADAKSDEWVNIYDATKKELSISYAMLEALLDDAGSTYIRCSTTKDDETVLSSPVCVTVAYVLSDDKNADSNTDKTTVQTLKKSLKSPVAVQSDPEYVDISINYLDAETGLSVYPSYTAKIEYHSEYVNSVISPTYLGYAPYYDKDNPSQVFKSDEELNLPDKADVIKINLSEDYNESSYVVNIYYKAIAVPWAAKYYFQNINDDFYTEKPGLYRVGYAMTGTYITDDDLSIKDSEMTVGFTKLYHYPEVVAADGSTVFECYYDRNYHIIQFDMDGGYGTEPVYARYETPFVVNEPTRHGYVFVGWDLLVNGVGDGVAETDFPKSMPDENLSYKALWKRADTQYTVVYWLQNADNDNYSYIGNEKVDATSGDIVSGKDMLEADTYICGENEHIHTDECLDNTRGDAVYVCGDNEHEHSDECMVESITGQGSFSRYVYERADQNVVVKGDGSSIVNVYYTRQYYTLRFVYAKEYNPKYDTNSPSDTKPAEYYIVGGSTYSFGNPTRTWPNGSSKDYTFEELIGNVGGSEWGKVKELPKLKAEYSDKYTTGTYPAEGYDKNGDRFYYFDLTGRYDEDLTQLWPSDVFDLIPVYTHTTNGANEHLDNDGWGNYAYLAGWNGEFKAKYSLDHSNTTIKGLFQKLDDTLLYGGDYVGQEETITVNLPNRNDQIESKLVCYLGFFNNGADKDWNVPRRWTYELYVPVLSDAEANLYYNGIGYKLYDTIETSDDGTVIYNYDTNKGSYVIHQTQPTLSGFTFDTSLTKEALEKRCRLIDNGVDPDKYQGRQDLVAQFFYEREEYNLVMHNYNDIYANVTVPFDTRLARIENELPKYPTTLEERAYERGGWYTSPECYDGSEFDPTMKMPANDVALYYKWTPKIHNVYFFKSYDDFLAYQETGDEKYIFNLESTAHGTVVGDVDIPSDPSGHNHTFISWFYINNEQKIAYTPSDIPVNRDMYVFADWGSHKAQAYRLYYALDDSEDDQQVVDLLREKAGGTPQNNGVYTIEIDGTEKNYIYLEKDNGFHLKIADDTNGFAYHGNTRTFYPKAGDPLNQLYSGYNNGYYPTLASHSLTIEEEDDQENPSNNVFTFTYKNATDVSYKVEYRYSDTNELIDDAPNGGSIRKTTTASVITERFAVIEGYVPDAFYKRLTLSLEKDENGNYINVITFYYSKNDKNAFYAVHYMMQNVDAAGTDLTLDDKGNYVNYTENNTRTEGIGDIGKEQFIYPQSFSGYTVLDKGYVAGIGNVTLNTSADDPTHPYFNITVQKDGTDLYIFYTRNAQEYKIYYLSYGTDISNLASLKYGDDGVLLPVETISENIKYGSTVTVTLPEDKVKIKGMNCASSLTQSIVIRANNDQNYIIFYYVPLQYTVEYRVWSRGGGTLSNTLEVVEGNNDFNGAVATENKGYTFDGWYLDDACTVPAATNPASDSDKAIVSGKSIIPKTEKLNAAPAANVFYAKFTPIYGSITITRNNVADTADGEQIFVYKITSTDSAEAPIYVSIKGNGSVTINKLICKDYTVEQVNGWSWRYSDAKQSVTVTKDGPSTVIFSGDATDKWINGNSTPIKNRKG